MFDLLIKGADLIDGTLAQRRRTDVAIQNGKFAALGSFEPIQAKQVINARGKILCPGFIDVHTHDDQLLFDATNPHPKLSQGVTTVVTGNCGISLAPLVTQDPPAPLDILGTTGFRYEQFADYLSALEQARPAVNAICLVGHSTLRVASMPDLNVPASPEQIEQMRSRLNAALDAGAWGLSTGVFYPPAKAATAQEIIAIGAAMAHTGAILTSHIRDEGDQIDAALDEALEIGRLLNVPLIISHHKLVGTQNHGRAKQTLARIRAAARTQSVCVDCYPYAASSTMLLPQRVAQSKDILITWSKTLPNSAGQYLSKLAEKNGLSPVAMAEALMPAGAIYFAMSEADVEQILADPLTLIGSDGLAHDRYPHPRLWGAFPRVLAHYSRQRGLFDYEQAIHKMTGLTATTLGLPDRGTIKLGNWADLVLFDPATVSDNATFMQPLAPATGIESVWVNGQLAYQQGQLKTAHAGKVLRRPGSSRASQ
jgi:N-acyl-D-amino-acid deacylase